MASLLISYKLETDAFVLVASGSQDKTIKLFSAADLSLLGKSLAST